MTAAGGGETLLSRKGGRASRYALLAHLSALLLISFASAQSYSDERLTVAYRLEREGKAADAIPLLTTLLQSQSLPSREQGKVWNVLGLAFEDLGELNMSRHAFEQSLHAYEMSPNRTSDYATALKDFGDLEALTGERESAMSLMKQAKSAFEVAQDHAGVARTCSAITGVLFSDKRFREGAKFLDCALAESGRTSDLDSDDQATLGTLRAWIAESRGDLEGAVREYEQSVLLLRKYHGEEHASVGWGYALLGRCHGEAGDLTKAREEMERGVTILSKTLDGQDPRLFSAQMALADLLRKCGRSDEAKALKAHAEAQRRSLHERECTACSISAKAYR